MQFASSNTLMLLLLLLPLTVLLLVWAARRQNTALNRIADNHLIERLVCNVNWTGRRWKRALQIFILGLLILSLARPQWGNEYREIEQEGLQVMIALDVSQSMLAQDVKPNRLDRAKLETTELMQRLDGDEVGIVLFSGASFVQVPLTSDYQTAKSYLSSAQPGVISRPGTAIGSAIQTAMNGFDPKLPSQKVLIVMTDGEDLEGDPIAAAKAAAEAGIMIYTIGFGTPEGEVVPETDQVGQIIGYKTDEYGNPVLSRLDEATLMGIANIGGGKYYKANEGANELEALLKEVDSLQKAQLANRIESKKIERYQLFLGLAFAAMILVEFIPDRKQTIKRAVGNVGKNFDLAHPIQNYSGK